MWFYGQQIDELYIYFCMNFDVLFMLSISTRRVYMYYPFINDIIYSDRKSLSRTVLFVRQHIDELYTYIYTSEN
jgi:hypothetical protein